MRLARFQAERTAAGLQHARSARGSHFESAAQYAQSLAPRMRVICFTVPPRLEYQQQARSEAKNHMPARHHLHCSTLVRPLPDGSSHRCNVVAVSVHHRDALAKLSGVDSYQVEQSMAA